MLLKNNIGKTLSLTGYITQSVADDEIKETEEVLSFFTVQETDRIISLIGDYEMSKAKGKTSRSGGGQVSSELKKIEYFREGLLQHVEALRSILNKEPTVRKSHQDLVLETQRATLDNLARGYAKLNHKALRSLAEQIIGDIQCEYTPEELPLKIAEHQVFGHTL